MEAAFGWQSTFIALFVAGTLALILVIFDLGETNKTRSSSFAEQFSQYPELLKSRRFWGYALVSACASGAFFAFLGGAPYVGSAILNIPPERLGMFFGLIAMGYMTGNFLTGRYAMRFGVAIMMLSGAFVAIFGMVLVLTLFLMGFQTPLALFGGIFFVGFGNGLTCHRHNRE